MQPALVVLVVIAALWFLGRRLLAFFRGQATPFCGCGCSGCGGATNTPPAGPRLPMYQPPKGR